VNSEIAVETAKITQFILPWIGILLSLMIVIWVKDFATSLAKGLKFKMNKSFQEGQKCILDGKEAIIVKIGTTETVFGVYSDRGYTWRYVPNEKIANLKLEKVINPDLHLDTDAEKAEKIQKMIDKYQDERISQNSNAIKNLKGKK
jgi:hypothetical protein